MKWMKLTALTGILACLSAAAYAEDKVAAPTTKPAADVAAGPAINKNCVMETDKPVDKTVFIIYKGQKIGFCCDDCIKDFKENPDKYVARLNKEQK